MNDLCARLAADLDRAFPDLVQHLQSDVYSGLRPLAGSDAEDLAQETFIRAYQALAGYDSDRIRELRLRGWIWTIALNLGRNHLRDRGRRPSLAYEMVEPAANDPDPPDEDAWRRRFSRLSPIIRRAVILRHVVGLGYEEIALALDRPVGTVKADVHRGLERLRRTMEEEP
jgi:RNA polymerase sigma-70 factor (ECF subfamily)